MLRDPPRFGSRINYLTNTLRTRPKMVKYVFAQYTSSVTPLGTQISQRALVYLWHCVPSTFQLLVLLDDRRKLRLRSGQLQHG